MQVLLSRDNQKGVKLEDILLSIIDDLNEKSQQLIKNSERPEINAKIIENNGRIKNYLFKSYTLQKGSMDLIAKNFGEDKGPNNPRL